MGQVSYLYAIYEAEDGLSNIENLDSYKIDTVKDISKRNAIVFSICQEIGYWRDAYHITNHLKEIGIEHNHLWIHKFLTKENIQTTKELCEEIILNPNEALKLLPCPAELVKIYEKPMKKYYDEIKNTIEIMNNALEVIEFLDNFSAPVNIGFSSSWLPTRINKGNIYGKQR